MRIWTVLLILLVVAVVALTAGVGLASSAPGEPNGLERAIAAQERHNPHLLAVPGVVGTGVGLAGSQPAVIIFTENDIASRLPAFVDGVPVVALVSGKFVALAGPPPGKGPKNSSPQVTITSPSDGAVFDSGETISFSGTASDREDGDLTSVMSWSSSLDGVIGGGGSFSRDLSDGSHTITAQATDSSGNIGSASVSITVGSPLGPTDRWPHPVPIGVSTGHINITAGTLGARVVDGQGRVFILSNNHVLADENRANIGDNVLQPGPYDGGIDPDDRVGTLYDYQPIVFSETASNLTDSAIALSSLLDVGSATPPDGYGTPRSATAAAYVNLKVKKYGRTTGFTTGRISAINATVDVGYDSGVARFVQQLVVTPGAFSAPGDSGSLIVVDGTGKERANDRKPVGLLFAGSSFYTLANPIDPVLSRYGVTIDGN